MTEKLSSDGDEVDSSSANDTDSSGSIFEPIVLIEETAAPLKFNQKYNSRSNVKHFLLGGDTIAGGRPHECSTCQKRFTEASNLRRHLKYHLGEKPFKCDVCMKQFTRNSDLKVHARIHSGERPYTCSICNRKFTYSSNLNSHIRIHTDGKPFNCSICNKNFNQLRYLKRHTKIHNKNILSL